MQGETTQRFLECINYLKTKNLTTSFRQFAISIEIHPQCISDIIRGKREVNSDIIQKSVNVFGINPNYIFIGEGSKLLSESRNNVDPILTVVTDKDNNERIAHIPISAQAGYGEQLHDPIYMKSLNTFSLPGSQFNSGTFRCFDIKGDSMEPTLYNRDMVVCSFVEKENWFSCIKCNYVYIVITHSDVIVKRVTNNLKSSGHLLVISDNDFYPVREIELREIVELWQVELKITPFMASPGNVRNNLHGEVELLRDTISDQGKLIQSLNTTIERLLKQNRTTISRI